MTVLSILKYEIGGQVVFMFVD